MSCCPAKGCNTDEPRCIVPRDRLIWDGTDAKVRALWLYIDGNLFKTSLFCFACCRQFIGFRAPWIGRSTTWMILWSISDAVSAAEVVLRRMRYEGGHKWYVGSPKGLGGCIYVGTHGLARCFAVISRGTVCYCDQILPTLFQFSRIRIWAGLPTFGWIFFSHRKCSGTCFSNVYLSYYSLFLWFPHFLVILLFVTVATILNKECGKWSCTDTEWSGRVYSASRVSLRISADRSRTDPFVWALIEFRLSVLLLKYHHSLLYWKKIPREKEENSWYYLTPRPNWHTYYVSV